MTQEQVQRMCDTMTRIFAARGGPFIPYYTVKPKGETTHENVYPHKSDTCAVHEAG